MRQMENYSKWQMLSSTILVILNINGINIQLKDIDLWGTGLAQ